jgi:DNA mismatch repair protein MutL
MVVPVQYEEEGITIEGYLGKPVMVRANRNFEIYFLNGRFIKSQLIAKAIEEGYKEYLMQHKFPFCVLHIRMSPERVDVNVHPTKMDVRFAEAASFFSILTKSVKESLSRREMIPQVSLEAEKKQEKPKAPEVKSAPEPYEKNRASQFKVMEEKKPYQAPAKEKQEFMKNPVWSRVLGEKKEKVDKTESLKEIKKVMDEADFFVEASPLPDLKKEPSLKKEQDVKNTPDQRTESGNRLQQNAKIQPKMQEAEKQPEMPVQKEQQMNLFEEKLLSAENRTRYHLIGQVFGTYWLIQFEDKLLIVDQHAAHEKIKYERLMKQYHEKQVTSQQLLPPVIVSLSGQEESVLKEHQKTFEALGFEVESFGGNEVAIRAVPSDLYGCSEKELFLEVLDELSEAGIRNNVKAVEEKIASMSCKAAVKGNHRISTTEAQELIDELLTLDNPYHCPHGRPTIITMTQAEMEKKFKRIVS